MLVSPGLAPRTKCRAKSQCVGGTPRKASGMLDLSVQRLFIQTFERARGSPRGSPFSVGAKSAAGRSQIAFLARRLARERIDLEGEAARLSQHQASLEALQAGVTRL